MNTPSTINFLDLTIYKGPHFPFTNILDTKTYQKPLNLYQYVHFTSTHTNNIFKSIIKGEGIRYVRTNTTEQLYLATVHIFTQRLSKRGYPISFVKKVQKTVQYSNRHKYLQQKRMHQPTCFPPLFKYLPPLFKYLSPPQYKALKHIILQNYSQIHFISPRFIPLRHPTLKINLSELK